MQNPNKKLIGNLFNYPNSKLCGDWGYVNLDSHAVYHHLITKEKTHFHCNPLLNPQYCTKFVNLLHKELKIDYSYGGYLENRACLWQDHYHKPDCFYHLGIDYNVPVGTKVYLPADGTLINLFHDNDHYGGWGGVLIFNIKNMFVVFAHLNIKSPISDYPISKPMWSSKKYKKGKLLGIVADYPDNGNWYPHLHIQCISEQKFYSFKNIKDLDGYSHFYNGIREDYPDPLNLFM